MTTVTSQNYPAISVIIPMYNAENYIEDCLKSLLMQTFQNFEVILVDDCSTDNSVAVAQKFMEKFEGNFVILTTEKNSGNFGYTARNNGFDFARGEYVFFMDADDAIIYKAFQGLYKAAKSLNVDVIYTGARYLYTSNEGPKLKRDKEGRMWKDKGIAEKPTLITNEPHRLLKNLLLNGGVFWTAWTKFVRRKFLIEKDIKFYEIISGSDFLWTIELFCCAERFLRIPNAIYFWRNDAKASATRKKRLPDVQISTWSRAYFYLAQALKDLANRREILKEDPLYLYFALKRHLKFCLKVTSEERLQFKSKDIYEILWREFEGKNELDMLTMFFLSFIDLQQKEIDSLKDKEPQG